MKSICLFFQVHQPVRFKTFRFFDIGREHYYYDDFSNELLTQSLARNCFLPFSNVLNKLSDKMEGRFKCTLALSGISLDLAELYAPEVISAVQKLSRTGCIEFAGQTNCNSLASLVNRKLFAEQVNAYAKRISELTGQSPKTFCNTGLIYNDQIGSEIERLGYAAVLTEGAKQVLGWKSPGYLYVNALQPRLKVLMRNFKLSDDIAFRFSDTQWDQYPLNARKFVNWLEKMDPNEEVIPVFMGADIFDGRHSGIFPFFGELVELIASHPEMKFVTPCEIVDEIQPVSAISVPDAVSWMDEERDLTSWTGNALQKEALAKLYDLYPKVAECTNKGLLRDWNFLQNADIFYEMSTKISASGKRGQFGQTGYQSPYNVFINYMNVLSDFKIRLG